MYSSTPVNQATAATLFLSACMLILLASTAHGAEIRVAVASNFAATLSEIAQQFEKETGHRVRLSTSSTGKHYAQILNGAPFDAFFAADIRRPQLLEQQGMIVEGSRFTYATGKLALWSPNGEDAQEMLLTSAFKRLAIANPRLAPYGLAARQVLETWNLWHHLEARLVRGENVAQAYQFVATGNAQAGLVALSQLRPGDRDGRGAYRIIPDQFHTPIRQDALLLRPGAAAEAFVEDLRNEPASAMIRDAGYGLPGHP